MISTSEMWNDNDVLHEPVQCKAERLKRETKQGKPQKDDVDKTS